MGTAVAERGVAPEPILNELLYELHSLSLGEAILLKLGGFVEGDIYGFEARRQQSLEVEFADFLLSAQRGAVYLHRLSADLEGGKNYRTLRAWLNESRLAGTLDDPGCEREVSRFVATFAAPETASRTDRESLIRYAKAMIALPLHPYRLECDYQKSIRRPWKMGR